MKKISKILQLSDLTSDGNDKLNKLFDVVSLAQLEDFRENINGLVTVGGVKVSSELLGKLPNLKIIATRSVGFDHIDLEAAFKRNIVVTNTPDVLTDCVADLAFGSLIAISRQFVQTDNYVREVYFYY